MPPRTRATTKAAGPDEYDPATRFLYVPHTVTFLIIGLLGLVYYSQPFSPPDRPTDPALAAEVAYSNAKAGVTALVLVFLGYSVVQGQGPSTRMVRPHPAVWRLVHALMVCYLLLMVFLLFQNVDDARQFLKHISPDLGVDLPERAYGTDCRLVLPGWQLNWPVLESTLFDEFVVAHTLGWWCKALMLRDNAMLWTISILFELMELTFQHMLPNFNECWWDSWVLDVAVCNWLGIAVGMWTVRHFKSKEYNWRGISQQPTLMAKAQRGLMQFTPYSFEDYRWQAFSSPKRCLQCLVPPAGVLLFEVNHFFLKYVMWVPPSSWLNVYRLVLLVLLAVPGLKEYYEFIESPAPAPFLKLGTFAWLGVAIALVETLTIVKFGRGLFPQPWPRTVLLVWGTVLAVSAAVFVSWSVRYYRQHGSLGTTAAAAGGGDAASGAAAAPRRRSRSVKRA